MTGKEIIIELGRLILPPDKRYPGDPGFELNNDELLTIYRNIYLYMVNEKAAMKVDLMPYKSLMFCGSVGTGKTIAMKVMQQMALKVKGLEKREMCIVHVNDFLKVFKEDQNAALDYYGYNKKMEMCIDELGWEAAQKNYYGNDTSAIIGSWIMERNKLFVEEGIRTHFTTNLFVDNDKEPIDLFRLYGPRVYDRIGEMTNVINWAGGSLR